MHKKIFVITFTIVVILLVALVARGSRGNPVAYQSGYVTRVGGPFEASNSTARYALVEAIVEDNTFELNKRRANFASPDVVETGGKFFSIFTPGVSFIAVPFYVFGKFFSLPQLGAFSSVMVFAIINFLLISLLARKLGSGFWGSILSGFVFTFATNALAYSQTLTQHHMSVTAIVAGILLASGKPSFIKNTLFGLFAGVALLLDVPAFLLMIPVGLWLLSKNIGFSKIHQKANLTVKLGLFGLLLGFVPLIMLFGYYNYQTTGSYTTLAQSVGRTDAFAVPVVEETKEVEENEIALGRGGIEQPFDTREQIRGLYILLMSNERAWIFYSPVVLLGIPGLVLGYRRKLYSSLVAVVSTVVLLNIVLYSMFGDPWGGWAFGPRYLIPAAALLTAAIPLIFVSRFKYYAMACFIILFGYSAYISALGALSTNSIPPKVEAVNLPDPIPYTFEYNHQFIEKNQSSSLIYNLYLSPYINSKAYLYTYATIVILLGIGLSTTAILKKEDKR